MRYHHSFQVRAPLENVASFHSRSSSMGAITPPPIVVRIRQAPEHLAEGDKMDFTLWIGPLPIHWQARIEAVSVTGFTDRQLSGPFGRWVHTHTFSPIADTITQVNDEIALTVKPHPLWGPVGLLMALGLPVLFAYRAWKTRSILESM